ncbi:MAG: hypothetical protein KI785_03980, partial [Devosiaceae bacterium]|nr:hypothetical protein [Devosiaceae bacterium MH13]
LPGSIAAPSLVRWYNAHPDHTDLDPRLGRRAVVVGHGNVALDTVRMLLSDPEMLITTDMMPEAAVRIASSQVKEAAIVGRTGPSQASFTPKELVELSEVPGVQIIIDPADLEADVAHELADPQAERRRRRNLDLFEQWAHEPLDPNKRPVPIRFFQDPVAIVGDAHVTGFKIERTRVVVQDGRAVHEGLGWFETIACDSVIRAIGFKSVPLDGVPFDEGRARFPVDEAGRIVETSGAPMGFVYASGWARRGPVGVIGTNKTDAEQVAQTLIEDLEARGGPFEAPGLPDDAAPVRLQDWADLAREEKRRGAIRGHGPLRFIDSAEAVEWLSSYGRRRLNDPTIPPEYPEVGRPDTARVHQ